MANVTIDYLTIIHCTCKFDNHKLSLLNENYEQTLSNKKHKQSNEHEKRKQSFPSEIYNRTFRMLRRPIIFLRVRCSISVRCSILVLLIKTVRCRIVRCSIMILLIKTVRCGILILLI